MGAEPWRPSELRKLSKGQEPRPALFKVRCDACGKEQYVGESQPSGWYYLKKEGTMIAGFCSIRCAACGFLPALELFELSQEQAKEVTGQLDIPGVD